MDAGVAEWTSSLLWLTVLLSSASAQGGINGFINFVQDQVVVNEGTGQSGFTSVQVPLVREGGVTGLVFAGLTISGDGSDFLATTSVVSFNDGVATSDATLVIVNDNLPEGNETFTVTITDARNGAEIGIRNTMTLVILASDEPFGSIQFDSGSQSVMVDEPLSSTDVQLTITRGPGTFGRVTVDYQVTSDPSGADDLALFMGQLVFEDGVSSQLLTLTVLPDDTPERDEVFTVQLTNPRGGALLAGTGTSSMVTIRENDAPLRWSVSLVEVEEDVGSVQLTITRGLLEDSSSIGDLSQTTTVTVTTISGTASSGSDFTPVSTTVTFGPGSERETVTIAITDDQDVEGDEMFSVMLSSPSSDSVLIPPSSITVIIAVNDGAGGVISFASPGPVIIQEDSGEVGRFIVQRSIGTFGNLTVEWRITDITDNQPADEDFRPSTGTLAIPDGANEATLEIVAFNDELAEIAEGFNVELVRVVTGDGSLSETGVRVASLIVAESDDVYGLVEWGDLLSVADTTPRELRLVVVRTLGDIGTISVDYTIMYLPPGASEGAVAVEMGAERLQGGQSSRDFSVTIPESMFLEPEGTFSAVITNTSLVGGATLLVPSAVSPRIGPRATVNVTIPVSAANGYIGFHSGSQQVSVEEPASSPLSVSLTVTRSGSYGLAEVTWAITTVSADFTDIGATSGVVTIPHGSSSAQLDVIVLPDDMPEIAEVLLITLITVNQNSQMIRANQNTATVTILQNDAAEGVFSISSTTAGPFLVDESVDGIISIAIVREGGALTQERISYNIPGGNTEILGGQSFATFDVGQREAMVTLLIIDDDIPETNETYMFEISSFSGNDDILGMPRTVEITILANDDYAGLFQFDSASLDQTAVEPRDGDTSAVTFTVQRSRGQFTAVDVMWEVIANGFVEDIEPTQGVVSFVEDQMSGTFQINVLPDNVPEQDEVFDVHLTGVSGAGSLGTSSTQAQLTVSQNDDPINFRHSFVSVGEGQTAVFVVDRGGQRSDTADVTFTVGYSSATSDDVTVSPAGGLVTFAPGQTEMSITVNVIDDDIPEESETLTVSLVSTTGDAVIVTPNEVTLLVTPSDDPNGVFQFEMATEEAEEGEGVFLSVERLGGDFGTVVLSWTVYQLNSTMRLSADVSDISPTTDILTFEPGNTTAGFTLNIIDDTLPELAERFEIELSIFNIMGDSPNGARIGDIGIATLTVGPSDDPYGLFSLSQDYVEVAEDIPPSNPSLGSLSLPVLRESGNIGEVIVVWEILPEALPTYADLLLVGEAVSGVTSVTSRPHTGTRALNLRGNVGDLLTVPLDEQPNLTDQLTISLWLRPTSGTSGILVAQATDSTPLYRLSLVADSVNFIIRFSYRSSSALLSVETSLTQSTLTEGTWHSLVVSATNQMASFYVDGTFLTSRIITSPMFGGRGQLTVGGVSGSISSSDFYSGDLQDVRVFSTALTQNQVSTLTNDLAALSITPISGYLTYAPGVTIATISTSTIDDDTPEPSQQFTIQLANTAGGARINPSSSITTLNILKSDSSNGVFGFDPSSVTMTTSEGARLSFLITRSEGTFGDVSVYWEIQQSGVLASLDFAPYEGQVDFVESQLNGTFEVMVVDELVPELQEDFIVVLASAVANDNQTSSTPLSGASIDPASNQASVLVTENDSPYGLLQFVTSPPLPGVTITPATQPPELFVEESIGMVTVYVVRAQGRLGDASVEYVTSEGSAVSGGGSPDFVPTAGTLGFSGDMLVQVVNVTVLDNQLPELQKTFYVNLTNPSGSLGTPDLSLGSSLAIHILPSDDAFGRFTFSSDSQARVVAEQPGGTPVTLSVVRDGGMFGDVRLYWRVTSSLGSEVNDISPVDGTLVFSEGSTSEVIELTIRDDLSAELSEVFTVTLVNVTVGASLGPASAAVITIAASDHPYGLFAFAPPPTGVSEDQDVVVTVIREFGTVGQVTVGVISVDGNDPRLGSLGLDLMELGQTGQLATPGLDYAVVNTAVTFEPDQTTSSLSLTLLNDTLPELRELVFLALTQATLNTSSVDAVDTSVLPQVAPGNESIAVIEIAENDNARGVVELSQVAVTATEPSGQILSIVRREGTFGEISVQWETFPVTASESDYSLARGTVTFAPMESEMPLPLTIIDDNIPEFSEEFLVRLVGVSGSATLGDAIVAMVTIEANDDPNGALGFSTTSLEVAEPDGNTPTQVALVVQRVGGAVGVVEVSWNVTSVDGSPVSNDVIPVSGTLQFVSNSRQQSIRLSVLPDQTPELAEVFVVRLGSVSGGARVEETLSTATLTIPGNDNPYGIVSFVSPTSVAMEIGENGTSVTMVPLVRSLGTFGDLLVTYSVQSTDAATLALASGRPLLDFYTTPTSNTALSSQSQLQALQGSLSSCATSCLGNEGCRSFSISGNDCRLYFTSSSLGAETVVAIGTDYYEKIEELVNPFYQAVASEGNDFTPVVGRTITVPADVSMVNIPVTIIGDALPELNESLVIRLGMVELSSGDSSSDGPALGSITVTSLVILENDDPHGRFAIYGSNGAAVTRVSESEMFDFGVSLTVERLGGTLGAVTVQWGVAGSTAVEGDDYTGTGAVLTFSDGGVTRATVALTILADDIPEQDETIQVVLSNPMGGATVGDRGTTLIIIEANDNAGGVVGFAPLSRSAVIGEGESGSVELVRSVSAFGVVRVSWRLTNESGADPVAEFVSTSGMATFQEGENSTQIVISVQADSSPEVEERYTLTLVAVETISDNVSPSGHAIFDPLATMATVTIQASNNPHGVIEFQSDTVRLEEGGAEGVAIVRQFGAFGEVNVTYSVERGSRGVLTPGQTLATPAVDFVEVVDYVRMVDGQQSAVISVTIVDDVDPELDEVFIVRLTSVTLVGGASSTLPPSIGAGNVSDVIITANDSPQGEMTFAQAEYEISEDVGVFQLPILRVQGLVGEVSVVYFVTNGLAVNGEDFTVNQLEELTFAPGETRKNVSIVIADDTIPEISEGFCVQLQLPRFGAVLGNITTTCVTIAANDDAYGVFSFEISSLATTIQETVGVATDVNVAELRVRRDGGLFETVTVPFEVRSADNELTTSDLSPLMGSALVFNPEDSFRIIQLEALQDSIPELDETFFITLQPPIEFGRLANKDTVATVTIESNQDPYGVFELSVVGGATSVEEDAVIVDFTLSRMFGTFGEVAVTMETVDGAAVFSPGSSPVFAAFQSLSRGWVWHSLSVGGGRSLLVLGGDSEVQLLAWRGVFTLVQTLPATQVSAITSFSPQPGVDLLLVGNRGFSGNRQLTVDMYQFTGPEAVTLVQRLPSQGVSDLATFSVGDQWYVLVANGEDNAGNNIVDSTVWFWNGTALELAQGLPTIGASSVDVFTLSGPLYAVVGSLTDSRSQVYVWREGQLRLHHNFDSNSVQDVLFIPPSSLAVASQNLSLLVWSPNSQAFVPNSTLSTEQPIRLELFNDQLFVTNANSPGQIFSSVNDVWTTTGPSLPLSRHLYPFTLDSTPYLASAGASRSVVMETLLINATVTDYYSQRVNLTFAPEESELSFSVRIVNDEIPEIGETFSVQLMDPVGGARIGDSGSITVEILTNDDAHGLIGFAEDSLSVIVEEGDVDSTVVLDVVRMGGAFGRVSVAWVVSGNGEITPTQGEVVFADGQFQSTITLTLAGDSIPELSEMAFVTLDRVVENGVPEGGDSSQGASITPGRHQAVITVQASDFPHGVVSWMPAVVMTTEVEGADSTVTLTLVREFGSIGAIVIGYSTATASQLPAAQQARALMDYVPSSGEVVMADNVTVASVTITILHDDLAELTESFLVNITSVELVNEADRQGSVSDSPRVEVGTAEVQIVENDDSRGSLSFTVTTMSVEETVGGRVQLEVRRAGGTFGEVGVEFTAVGVSASSLDFEPASGTLTFESGVVVGFVEINIINDPDPELAETFEVTLVNGIGGVTIGEPSSVLVTILPNDDINGVFSFTETSLLFLIPESSSPSDPMGVVTLTVQRTANFVGVVTVYWEIKEDGQMDLEPTGGNLTFVPPTSTQSFQVRAINDGLPEVFEAFSVRLVGTEGGGRIIDPREARIAIQSSNDPSGVVGFSNPQSIIIANEGVEIQVGVVRRFGTQGTVTLTWAITPPDSTVFLTTTDTVVFTDGQSVATFAIQTVSDSTPEVARLFSLDIVSASLATIDVNSTHIDLIIAASDNPHGTVEFASGDVSVEEGAVGVAVTVVRGTGVVGDLGVNVSLQLGTADLSDFNISSQYLIIPSGLSARSLSLDVFDDPLPEIAETFTLTITAVELLGNGGRDFEFIGDPTIIDQPPVIGPSSQITVTIPPSDDPFGSVTLTQDTYMTQEGDVLNILLTRTGGAIGVASVSYTTSGGTATSPADYSTASGTALFLSGETSASISITIFDDNTPEVEEFFTFTLTSSTSAILGPVTMATVIIDASDSPSGVVGFGQADVSNGRTIANPTVDDGPQQVELTVTRMGGTMGSTEITWEVRRSNGGDFPRDDIMPVSDTLMFADGDISRSIQFDVLPSNTDEAEESYIVTLVLASNDVTISPALASVTITVQQIGNPQGVVSFIGDVLSGQRVNEGTTLSLPVVRTGAVDVELTVSYIVTRNGGSGPVSDDVTPATGTVIMPLGIRQVNLDLSIVADGVAELDESFQVVLTGTNINGVGVDLQANTAPFTVSISDSPFGQFSLSSATVSLDSTQPLVLRSLRYTIERSLGLIGDVTITISNSYTDSSVEYVPPTVTRVLSAGSSSLTVSLNIASGAFLSPGSEFMAMITSAVVATPAEFSGQSADFVDTAVVGVVSEETSNTLVSLDPSSLSASVNDNDGVVQLMVSRVGSLDTVDVQWSAGPLVGGALTPPTGTVVLTPSQQSAVFSLTATPTEPHGMAEVFSVRLTVQSRLANFPARVDEAADTALIEPWGVLELGAEEFSGVEGQVVPIPVLRRYGSVGEIIVTGVASTSTDIPTNYIAATAGVDFPVTPLSVTMGDSQTTGSISISLPDNLLTSPLKVFTFTLTAVSRVASTDSFPSPRLSSSNLIGQVTIVDDEGGAGVFRVSPNIASVEEGGVVSFTVMREGGSAGDVSVLVRTVDGGASGDVDYTSLNQQLDFEDGVFQRQLTIPILDDDLPEVEEGFRVELVGGIGALVDPVNGVLDVTIPASDNPGGVFTISTPSPLTLTDGITPSATVTVERTGGLIGVVTINWEAVYADSATHEPLANFLSETSGRINFLSGQTTPDGTIQLSLISNAVPAGGETFVLRISSSSPGAVLQTSEIQVIAQARTVSVFQIQQQDRTRVVTASGPFTMTIQRTDGLQLTSTINYETNSMNRPDSPAPSIGELTFDLAQPGMHFAVIENAIVTFEPGDSEEVVILSVISVPSAPLLFYLDVSIQGTSAPSDTAAIVVMPLGSLSDLYSLYFQSLTTTTPQELESVSESLVSVVSGVNGRDSEQSTTVHLIINQLISTTLTSGANVDYTRTNYVINMLDVFNSILTDSSFSGQSLFVQSMKSFAYSLVEDDGCPTTNTEVLRSYSRSAFFLEGLKIRPELLVNRRFTASASDDYVQFPSQSLSTSQSCVTVHFIEFLSNQIFGQPTFGSKVMSVGVANRDIQPVPDHPILLRLHTDQTVGAIPDSNDCIHWAYPSSMNLDLAGRWSSEFCSPVTEYGNVLLEDSILCSCRQFGDLAVASNVTLGYSWTWPAGVSAGFVAFVMVLVMILHLCFLSRTQLATRLLVCLCLAVFLFQLMLFIDVFASRSPSISADGCVTLGALLHFTIVLQFVFIMALAIALWVNFMGFTDGREPLVAYVIIGWGVAIVVVVLTILIGRFAVPLSNTELYFHTNGELCFIPSLPVSLLSVVLPVILSILVVGAFLSHSCVYWSRWEDYHNMYHDSFNRTEIPLLLVFFALIFFTGLAGYLHVYVTVVYTFAVFVALNVIQGVYALIVYFFISWHTLTSKHKKFVLGDEVEPLPLPEEPDYLASMDDLSTSRHRMDPQEEWDKDSDETPVVGVGMTRYEDDDVDIEDQEGSQTGNQEDSHLDDLMFMLKTQTYESDKEGPKGTPTRPKGAEHLELRRISIADTHL